MQCRKKTSSAKPTATKPKAETGPSMSGDCAGPGSSSGVVPKVAKPARCQSPTFLRVLREVSEDADLLMLTRPASNTLEGEISERILALTYRVYEMEDKLSNMIVQRLNLKNEVLTLQDENLQLQLALNRERKKVERAWNQLDESARPRDVSPPRPPPRGYQQSRGRAQQPAPPPPPLVPFRIRDAPAGHSCTLCPCLLPWNLNENDLQDFEEMLEEEMRRDLAHRYIMSADHFERYNGNPSSLPHGGRNQGPQGASGPSRPPRLLEVLQAQRQQIVQHEHHMAAQLPQHRQQQPQPQRQQQQQQQQQDEQAPQRPPRQRRQPPSAHHHNCVHEGVEEGSRRNNVIPARAVRGRGGRDGTSSAGGAANRSGRHMFTLNNRPLDYEPLPLD